MSTDKQSKKTFCCAPFREAYENGVINIPNISYIPHEGLEMDKYYLFDRDCGVVDVTVPIRFCPYCARDLNILGRLRKLFEDK